MDLLIRPDNPEIYRRVFQDSTDAIIITDVSGRIVMANRAWLDLYGYSLDEVRGRTTSLVKSAHTSAEVYRYMWERILDPAHGYWKGEIVNRKRNGEEVPILLTITPIRMRGETIGYTGIGIDLTERRENERARELYETIVRHDLKAPLGAIIALLHTLHDGYAGRIEEKPRAIIGRILHQAERMQAMIETSLDLERMKRGKLPIDRTEVDLVAAARESRETLSSQAARKNVQVVLRCQGRPARTGDRVVRRLDPIHTQRCANNLLKNAIEASAEGGEVVVDVSVSPDKGEERGRARLRVTNHGPVIPPDVRATLFHPFSTFGKRGGTGLGVYGVKLLVEAMGGSIAYETGERETWFEISFPEP